MFEPGLLATLAITFVGGIVWAVRVEGKVNGHQTLFDEREKQSESREKRAEAWHDEIQDRMIRIEDKIDRRLVPRLSKSE